jgi:adenylosuccinate synthase
VSEPVLHAVVGANWGDEGKGRMVDYLSQDADIVVRYQGGNNAGHTVVNEFGTFKLNLLPSGICRPGTLNIIGPGTVVDVEALANELAQVRQRMGQVRLLVSDKAAVTFPFHRYEDAAEEERLGAHSYGSTKRGIAYAYGDRYLKKSLLLGELLQGPEFAHRRLAPIIEWKNAHLSALYGPHAKTFSVDEMVGWATEHVSKFADLITDTSPVLRQSLAEGQTVMLEAQLGALRDIYYGIYPFTTSSCTLASFGPTGAGAPEARVSRVTAVVKAFSSCVGEGPFVTEMFGEEAAALRDTAEEYGAATGRPRRVGHFDAVATAYGAKLQGATEIALTKLDCLSGAKELKICRRYKLHGELVEDFPAPYLISEAEPDYDMVPGWEEDISGARSFSDLPPAAAEYVLTIERSIGVPVRFVSVGPDREAIIDRHSNTVS